MHSAAIGCRSVNHNIAQAQCNLIVFDNTSIIVHCIITELVSNDNITWAAKKGILLEKYCFVLLSWENNKFVGKV